MINVDLNIDLRKIPLLSFEELRKYYILTYKEVQNATTESYSHYRYARGRKNHTCQRVAEKICQCGCHTMPRQADTLR